MDLSAMNRTASRAPLTVDEKQRRYQQGLCLYCGTSGHLAAVCPAKSTRQVRQMDTEPLVPGHRNRKTGSPRSKSPARTMRLTAFPILSGVTQ
jgi:hypothetical protein